MHCAKCGAIVMPATRICHRCGSEEFVAEAVPQPNITPQMKADRRIGDVSVGQSSPPGGAGAAAPQSSAPPMTSPARYCAHGHPVPAKVRICPVCGDRKFTTQAPAPPQAPAKPTGSLSASVSTVHATTAPAIKYCSANGHEVPANALICQVCGDRSFTIQPASANAGSTASAPAIKYCGRHGHSVPGAAVLCPQCGDSTFTTIRSSRSAAPQPQRPVSVQAGATAAGAEKYCDDYGHPVSLADSACPSCGAISFTAQPARPAQGALTVASAAHHLALVRHPARVVLGSHRHFASHSPAVLLRCDEEATSRSGTEGRC